MQQKSLDLNVEPVASQLCLSGGTLNIKDESQSGGNSMDEDLTDNARYDFSIPKEFLGMF